MNNDKFDDYARRFEQVFDFIEQHLDSALTVEQLSEVACFSRFHFHRQFSQFCGVSVSRYITLMRLKRASYRLVQQSPDKIIDIALDAGFENPESFSRAFKHTFGLTPSEFRKAPVWMDWHKHFQFPGMETQKRMEKMDVKIIEVEPIPVAVLEHHGEPMRVSNSVATFIEWRKASGLSDYTTQGTYGVPYNDPLVTPGEEFRFDICGELNPQAQGKVPANSQGVISKTLPGGRCAVVRHVGSYDRISETVYNLYRQWLPQSGEELRDFPVYFRYLQLDQELPEHAQQTDILLPLK
ncbi:AraC family transcriptional regulator [Ewingella americana]|uniref:AraC family transcriptional regulator n=1 Tax=Ewingella americana TaxID=41202 RepID=UPI000C2FA0C5|nr:AraC family transcriptional regulator [Ewingella americana]PKB87713.1 AraC family transcriptional regulator [Ewingella americana]QMV50592.1 AraC family transcriptional regulator [Ewingella americana]